MEFFGDVERFLVKFYPYRWWITAGAVMAVAGAVALGYRMGWHKMIWQHRLAVGMRQHRLASAMVLTPLLGLFVLGGYYTVSPIFERTTLVESSPLAATTLVGAAGKDTITDATPTSPVKRDTPIPAKAESAFTASITYTGEFQGTDSFHFGRGQALLIETSPGEYTLRFENFSVRNGPDLFVYLSPKADGYANDSLLLGELKATDGAFNYEVPMGTDVSQFKSVVVWCKAFGVLFAVCPLTEQ